MFTRQEAYTSEQLNTYPGPFPQSVWFDMRWWTSQRFRLSFKNIRASYIMVCYIHNYWKQMYFTILCHVYVCELSA